MDSIYIVMPAYNEESNIKDVVSAWYALLSDKNESSRLVIADSGSTDHTHEILLKMLSDYPKLEIISDTDKQHGPKLMALYDYAIKNGADYIFQTDSDGQTAPAEFNTFWNARNKYDGIFGYRQVREDGKSRAFVEHIVCLILRMYFGVKIPDANAPFRLMKATTVKKYLFKLPANYNLPNIMITTYFIYYNEKTAFKKITFKPRQGGTSSINIRKIVKIGFYSLLDFRKLKKEL